MIDEDKIYRPAGSPVLIDNNYFLPTQYNKRVYGEYIVFREFVIDLNDVIFTENNFIITFDNISRENHRMHTYNKIEGLTIIDVYKEKIDLLFVFSWIIRKLFFRKKGKKYD